MKLFPDPSVLDKILPELRDEYAVGVPRFSEEVQRQLEEGDEDVLIDVVGYEGYVLNVRTLEICKKWTSSLGVPLRLTSTFANYQQVNISRNNKGHTESIHILNKNTLFINPDPQKFTTIEHLDCDPSNNHVSNLVFASMKFQGHRSNKKTDHKSNSEKKSRVIQQFILDGQFVREFKSAREAAIEVTGDGDHVRNKISNIRKCANGKAKTACGFVWKYTSEPLNPDEVWKEVPDLVLSGRDAPYTVSNLGLVKNRHDQIMKGSINQGGYVDVCNQRLHRIVAITWIPNPKPDEFTLVGHSDDNKLNCAVENLYWTDHKGNADDAHRTGASGASTVQVRVIYQDGSTKIFQSRKETAAEFNVTPEAIGHRIKHKRVIDGVRFEKISDRRRHHTTPI